MTAHAETKQTAVPFAGLTGPAGFVAEGILAAVSLMVDLVHDLDRWHRERAIVRELSALSDHQLDDIGLNRGDIAELARGKTSGAR